MGIAVSDGTEIAREIADIMAGSDDLCAFVTLKTLRNMLVTVVLSFVLMAALFVMIFVAVAHQFGVNRREQLACIIVFPFIALALAWISILF